MLKNGWFKMNREIFTDDIVTSDSDHLAVWCFLCANASYTTRQTRYNGKVITLRPGQLITSRRSIAAATKVDPSKVERVLKVFIEAKRVSQRTCSSSRLITILEPQSED